MHMKDLVNIIAKVIEKKPLSYYILAFDQTANGSLKNIIRMIYYTIGDENKMIEKKEIKENKEVKDENNNDINKDIIVKEEKEKEENEKRKKVKERN